ncbi:MAG TPA: hypothetical protein VMG12_20175 [Polyangiaceae bacterium]|nr:hypothetical protein [Polyangiaceae bacterium]
MQHPVETTNPTPEAVASGPSRAPRWVAWAPSLALGAVLAGLCVWRLACVSVGPDPDTDAYGHYVIAQQLLETPWNFKIHWVWLPLYHLLLALGVALGAGLDQVRAANAIAATAPALVLFWALARKARGEPLERAVAGLAALLTALSPLISQLGTTGQMEIAFCLLSTLTTLSLSERRFGLAAVGLSALVLTRYEGWAVAAVVGAELVRQHWAERRWPRANVWACFVAPLASVIAWAALRRSGGEPWFGFIADNQAFAERVIDRFPSGHDVLRGFARYTLEVPFRAFGFALPFVALGISRTWRRSGVWFVAPGLAIIAFLTLSSLSHSQLGLDRHYLSVVPFAATWLAHGVARAAEWLAAAREVRRLRRVGLTFAALSACIALGAALRLHSAARDWWERTRTALAEPRAVAEFLRSTPEASLIVCDEASVEVLSGLDRSRFLRTHLDERLAPLVAEQTRSRDVFIVNRARRLGAFLHAGPARYGALDGPPDAFVAIEVRTDARHAGLDG